MAKTSMEFVMSEDLMKRLQKCADGQGKSIQQFVQEALYTYVEDIEDGAMSDVALSEEGLGFLIPEGGASRGLDGAVLEVSRKTA